MIWGLVTHVDCFDFAGIALCFGCVAFRWVGLNFVFGFLSGLWAWLLGFFWCVCVVLLG